MRVLLIDVNCKSNSTGKLVYRIFQNLNKEGHDSVVCYGRGHKLSEQQIFKFGLDWETNIHALLTRVTGYTGCFSYFSTCRLIRYIEQFKPDVVHIHELHAYFVNIEQLFKYLTKKNIKTIFTLHCEFDYTGKCGHSIECEKWKSRCGDCPHLHDYPSVMFFDHTGHMHEQKEILFKKLPYAVMTTVSPWLTERAKQSFLREKNFYTIYNGVDTTVFKPVETNELRHELGINHEKVVVSVAPHIMNIEKGGYYIIKLAERMRDCIFILVGTDEQSVRKTDNVIYIPKVLDQDKLAQFYSIGSVFVICSLKETFSLTCAEALCCGTKIAGFKCGAPEMIFEEPFARFVEYGNVEELQKVVKLQMDSKLMNISNYGQKFSEKKMLDEYMQLYKNVIKQAEELM